MPAQWLDRQNECLAPTPGALIQAPPVRYILVPSERGVLSWAAAAIGAADT